MWSRTASVPLRVQIAANDCAPACVMVIAEHCGMPIALSEVRECLVPDPQTGTTIRNFEQLAPGLARS